jgi:hypothetical protein
LKKSGVENYQDISRILGNFLKEFCKFKISEKIEEIFENLSRILEIKFFRSFKVFFRNF